METLNDIKTYICDMLAYYCAVISSKDSSTQSKIAFTNMMRDVALRIVVKCGKLEKELEHEKEKTKTENQKAEEKG